MHILITKKWTFYFSTAAFYFLLHRFFSSCIIAKYFFTSLIDCRVAVTPHVHICTKTILCFLPSVVFIFFLLHASFLMFFLVLSMVVVWSNRWVPIVGGESSRSLFMFYNKDKVETIEFTCFNFVILYMFNLYKYRCRANILT